MRVLRSTPARRSAVVAAALAMVATVAPAASGAGDQPETEYTGLNGPRGVAVAPGGRLLVSQADGTISAVVRSGPRAGRTVLRGRVPAGFLAPAIDIGENGHLVALTVGGEPGARGAGLLYRWEPGKKRRLLADIQTFSSRARNADPYDLEDNPRESNPYGVHALPNGGALVADAAANTLLRVSPKGRIRILARFKPRTIEMPAGFDDPEMPPAGTPIPSESVPTSITVGADGSIYVGELRGFPATKGTSQIWRVKPGARNAVCDPERPRRGDCTVYADGLTSVVGLATGRGGSIYALELSRESWLAMEMQVPGAEVGRLVRIGHDRNVRKEIARGELITPGGVDVGPGGAVFVTTPIFGPGAVKRVL